MSKNESKKNNGADRAHTKPGETHQESHGSGSGSLPTTALEMSATASTSQSRILYNASTGDLAFDQDGSGTAYASAVFATLQNKPATLTATDFLVIA